MIVAKMRLRDPMGNKQKLTIRANDDEELSYSLRGLDTAICFSLSNLQVKGGP
jgi:hypothetical protein